jgi:glutaredoxin-related protein
MAHFAKLGANGKVIQVLTLNNSDMLNADGVEDESVGQQYLETHNNWPAQMWIQTSYNTRGNQHSGGGTPFRGN